MAYGEVYEVDFLYSLLYTMVVEGLVLYLVLTYFFKRELNLKDILFLSIFPSMATLPYLWFLLPHLVHDFTLYRWISEVFAVVVESLILSYILKLKWEKGFILSLVANLISYFTGTWLLKVI
jgi:hypothetical protein